MVDKLLTVAEVAHQLGLPEAEVRRLAETGALKALRLGGELLRFHPQDVAAYQATPVAYRLSPIAKHDKRFAISDVRHSWLGRVREFLYAYDFYVVVAVVFGLIVVAILTLSS